MVLDTCILRSTIKPEILRSKLMAGTAIAFIGVLTMLLSGIFLSPAVLSTWGLAIFFFGFGALALGLIPYRRLLNLEKKPSEIVIIEDGTIQYFLKGKKVLTIPQQVIDTIDYFESDSKYGICINLKPVCKLQIAVHNRSFNYRDFLYLNKQKYGCDLFFPYFSRRSCRELQTLILA